MYTLAEFIHFISPLCCQCSWCH